MMGCSSAGSLSPNLRCSRTHTFLLLLAAAMEGWWILQAFIATRLPATATSLLSSASFAELRFRRPSPRFLRDMGLGCAPNSAATHPPRSSNQLASSTGGFPLEGRDAGSGELGTGVDAVPCVAARIAFPTT